MFMYSHPHTQNKQNNHYAQSTDFTYTSTDHGSLSSDLSVIVPFSKKGQCSRNNTVEEKRKMRKERIRHKTEGFQVVTVEG